MSYFMEVNGTEAVGAGKEALKPCESESRHALFAIVHLLPPREAWSCSLPEDREPLICNPPNADALVKNLNLTLDAVQDSDTDILKAQIKMKLVCMDLAFQEMSTLPLYNDIPLHTDMVFFPAQARSCARRPAKTPGVYQRGRGRGHGLGRGKPLSRVI